MVEKIKKLYSLTVPDEILVEICENIYKFIEASNILEFDSEADEGLEE